MLPSDHPFVRLDGPVVYEHRDGWTVKWRDFLTVKQDACFDTEAEAEGFADRLRRERRYVPVALVDDVCMTFEEAERSWLELDEQVRRRDHAH